jgi:hypothetical protein
LTVDEFRVRLYRAARLGGETARCPAAKRSHFKTDFFNVCSWPIVDVLSDVVDVRI